MNLENLRNIYHQEICSQILHIDRDGVPNIADKNSRVSCAIAAGIVDRIGCRSYRANAISGQSAGNLFERVNRSFLQAAFDLVIHLRPGNWVFDATGDISQFYQYRHLADLTRILSVNPDLKTALGMDYLITPDVVVARYPVADDDINRYGQVISEDTIALLTPLRASNHSRDGLILHASVSIKWTLRSDRAQNARTEALNLIRNRKGHTPHIVAITAEPTPGRIASLALGTGDIDCVYHFALPEMRDAIVEAGGDDTVELLDTLVSGGRLKDIADLPFDLIL